MYNPSESSHPTPAMPDIAKDAIIEHNGALDWVGMTDVHMPIRFIDTAGQIQHLQAKIDAFVSLDDPQAKGIHMSRLYLALESFSSQSDLRIESLQQLLYTFLDSHQGLSAQARIDFSFDYLIQRPSLLSQHTGWKSYPIVIRAEYSQGKSLFYVHTDIAYSSTCPCSAALARQLIQQEFLRTFGTQHDTQEQVNISDVATWLASSKGIMATPHSQRSVAEIQLQLDTQLATFPLVDIIDRAEHALKTPVQAAVKREDEQEFARLNGQNNMFCEDAARLLKKEYQDDPAILDFRIQVNHYESLHAHNAVAIVTKGIPGGLTS